jgi:hypothetical protein
MKKLFQPAARLHLVLAVAAGMALSAGIGVASGAIPSSNGTINACQAKVGGFRYLRLLDTGESCRGGEKPLTWNQKGPAGPPGPAGPKGSGVGKLTMRQVIEISEPGTQDLRSNCKAGEKVTGGAAFVNRSDVDVTVIGTSVDADLTGFEATVRNNTGQNEEVGVQAICAA